MPQNMIIIKKDGTPTNPPMAQAQAQNYLKNLIDANRYANLTQSLNQAFDGNGKPTAAYKFANQPVLHASSGNGEKSVSLFYYVIAETITLFAMGEHMKTEKTEPVQYKLSDYGQPNGDFAAGKTIILPKN